MLDPWPSLLTFHMLLYWSEHPRVRPNPASWGFLTEDLRSLVPGFLGPAPLLRSFRFCPAHLLPYGFLEALVDGCPLLEEVWIDDFDFDQSLNFASLNRLPLKELRLRGGGGVPIPGFDFAFRGVKTLKVIDLRRTLFPRDYRYFPVFHPNDLYSALACFNYNLPEELLDLISRECPDVTQVCITLEEDEFRDFSNREGAAYRALKCYNRRGMLMG